MKKNRLAAWTNEVARNETLALEHKHANFAMYSALMSFRIVCAVIYMLSMAAAILGAAVKLHDRLLSSIVRTSLSFFEKTPIGSIINRFSADVGVVDNAMRDSINDFVACAFVCTSLFIAIAITLPMFLAVGVPLIALYLFVQRLFVTTMRQLKRIELSTRAPLVSFFEESVAGTSTIRAFGRERDFLTKFINFLDENHRCCYYMQMANRWLSVRMETVGTVIAFTTAMLAVALRKTVQPGELCLALSYAMSLSQTLTWVVRQSAEIESNIVSVERITDYLDTPKEGAWTVKEVDASPEMKSWPSTGEIVFENVVLAYRADLKPALRGASFTIKPREKIGVVGRTGAGKSTIGVALMRIVELTSGRILIDGVDTSKVGLHALRHGITIIPQETTLFSGTLRFNLDPFGEYNDEDIMNCLEHAELKDFVDEQPARLDMIIAEGGDNLSAGQRQLVCIARAILRRPPSNEMGHILLMDEATAAIDIVTDRQITSMVRREFENSTVLTIAHRLDTVIDYDKILVLRDGSVEEFDTPDNLLEGKATLFYRMAKAAGLVE